MAAKMTGAQMVGGFAAFMVTILSMNAIAWTWRDASSLFLAIPLVFFVLFLFFFYRAPRIL